VDAAPARRAQYRCRVCDTERAEQLSVEAVQRRAHPQQLGQLRLCAGQQLARDQVLDQRNGAALADQPGQHQVPVGRRGQRLGDQPDRSRPATGELVYRGGIPDQVAIAERGEQSLGFQPVEAERLGGQDLQLAVQAQPLGRERQIGPGAEHEVQPGRRHVAQIGDHPRRGTVVVQLLQIVDDQRDVGWQERMQRAGQRRDQRGRDVIGNRVRPARIQCRREIVRQCRNPKCEAGQQTPGQHHRVLVRCGQGVPGAVPPGGPTGQHGRLSEAGSGAQHRHPPARCGLQIGGDPRPLHHVRCGRWRHDLADELSSAELVVPAHGPPGSVSPDRRRPRQAGRATARTARAGRQW
jgi:hypothetical protein